MTARFDDDDIHAAMKAPRRVWDAPDEPARADETPEPDNPEIRLPR